MRKSILTACITWLIATYSFGQKPQVLFYGYVEEGKIEQSDDRSNKEPKKLKGVEIKVFDGATPIKTISARETGFYGVLLEAGPIYQVVFSKEGYFSKSFELDCRELFYPEDGSAVKCLSDISLFKEVDSAELRELSQTTYAKCSFFNGQMAWDQSYTAQSKNKFMSAARSMYTASGK
ncbi:MAG: hypothetical protein ACKO6L_09525 [Flavobacteriales bacterium]